MKFEKLLSARVLRSMATEPQKIIEMAQKFIKHISLRGLMRDMNSHLREYLGFEHINCIFLDPEINELYTITFGDDEQRI